MFPMTLSFIFAAWLVFNADVPSARQTAGATSADPAVRGQAIFEGKGDCQNCHRVRGHGSRLGPDLSAIGAEREAADLRQSIVRPDAEVLPHNRFYRVTRRDGSTLTGRLLNHDTFTVQLMSPKEELVRFRKAELRDHGFQKNSPMPSYEGKLTPEELADVVAYLASLKGVTK